MISVSWPFTSFLLLLHFGRGLSSLCSLSLWFVPRGSFLSLISLTRPIIGCGTRVREMNGSWVASSCNILWKNFSHWLSLKSHGSNFLGNDNILIIWEMLSTGRYHHPIEGVTRGNLRLYLVLESCPRGLLLSLFLFSDVSAWLNLIACDERERKRTHLINSLHAQKLN